MKRESIYDPLHQFLLNDNANRIMMTFPEIEKVLGFSLPNSAYKYIAWWDSSSQHTHAYAWIEAGYKAKPNMKEKKVEFVKFQELK